MTGENCVKQEQVNHERLPPTIEECSRILCDLRKYGVCTIDNFLGAELGNAILLEVKCLYSSQIFRDGQLVRNSAASTSIRNDKVLFVHGNEPWSANINKFIATLEKSLLQYAIVPTNKFLGDYNIKRRTKAMVSCYPGNGTYYRKHVDNPNGDGRRLTCLYYLNKDWDDEKMGGTLRIFPSEHKDIVANISPIFDRLVLFWSDRRNPHEVLPAFKDRFAITVWYCD
ncbi:hypothetical protein B4U80_10121 [Leptotrombidium deliense]|uniref:hypoxia-inducible factor-proline dioxygenase n=1 Tax=Leptotrombidium deliense TaxID=299467 RepID=A0A443SJX3_9ACAR|nr:hypothetical protein B4U80_10121 [Leptotrombidium deliense]